MSYGIVLNRNRPDYTGSDGPSRLEGKPDVGLAAAGESDNSGAVLALLEYRALEFNGRAYRVPNIEHDDGIRLSRLMRTWQRLNGKTDDASATEYESFIHDIVRVCGPLLVPMGWRRHWWRLMGKANPLKHATETELGAVLDFLFRCRMTERVRLRVLDPPRAST